MRTVVFTLLARINRHWPGNGGRWRLVFLGVLFLGAWQAGWLLAPATGAFLHKQPRPSGTGGEVVKVQGRVLSRPGGKGVAGVTVVLWSEIDGRTLKARTGANGDYVMDQVPLGVYTARMTDRPAGVWTDGVEVRVGLERAVRAPDLFLVLPQSVAGTVTNVSSGKPGAGAEIHFATANRNWDTIVTDKDGKYRLYVWPRKLALSGTGSARRYYPTTQADGRPEGREVTVAAGQQVGPVDFQVRSAPGFAAQLVDVDGKPASGVRVNLEVFWTSSDPNGGRIWGGDRADNVGLTFRYTTDAKGRFQGHLRHPFSAPKKDARLTITVLARTADGARGCSAEVQMPVPEQDVFLGHFKLSSTRSATLQVVDTTGKPILGAVPRTVGIVDFIYGEVAAVAEPKFKPLGGGKFRATQLLPGMKYRFYADAVGYQTFEGATVSTGLDYKPEAVAIVRLKRSGRSAVAELVKQLRDPDQYKREGACHELASFGPEAAAAVPALVESLKKDKLNTVRYAAAQALGKIGPPASKAVPDLIAALDLDSLGVDREAAKALGLIGDGVAVPALAKAARTKPDGDVRLEAVKSLAKLGPKSADVVPLLLLLLQEKEWRAKDETIKALGLQGAQAKAAVPELLVLLAMDGNHSRSLVAEALGRIGDPAALPALRRAAQAREAQLFTAAVLAIRRIEGKKE